MVASVSIPLSFIQIFLCKCLKCRRPKLSTTCDYFYYLVYLCGWNELPKEKPSEVRSDSIRSQDFSPFGCLARLILVLNPCSPVHGAYARLEL